MQKTHVYLKEPSDGILSELIFALDAIFMFFSLLGVLKLPAKLNVYLHQSVTYRYREFSVSGIFHFFCGIGKNWYRKKVSEPVSEKFGTGKKSRNRYRKNLVPEKGLGTGTGKYWYRS